MFLFHPIHFLKFLVKSQPQHSYKTGSYKKKKKECSVQEHPDFEKNGPHNLIWLQ